MLKPCALFIYTKKEASLMTCLLKVNNFLLVLRQITCDE
jgi:hypothetical protein